MGIRYETSVITGGPYGSPNKQPIKTTGWTSDIANFFAGEGSGKQDISNWFRNNYSAYGNYVNSLSDADIIGMLDPFWKENTGIFGASTQALDYDSINKYLSQLQNYDKILGEMPTAPDYEAIQKEVYNAINSENQELLGMLEQDLARQ